MRVSHVSAALPPSTAAGASPQTWRRRAPGTTMLHVKTRHNNRAVQAGGLVYVRGLRERVAQREVVEGEVLEPSSTMSEQ
eukprot:3429500-Rhodomonas_salina.3